MLISHLCKFIYLKTVKTAGTSVEIYFEPYCVDPKSYTGPQHARDAQVSDWGIVGSRGFVSQPWYNHMPAQRVRELVGEDTWNQYFKFCVVRNPFDKLVSHFWMEIDLERRQYLAHADFSEVRRAFLDRTQAGQLPSDRNIYTIGAEIAVDRLIRYERLPEDLAQVCHHLNLPWQPDRLGRYKSDTRKRMEPFADYYDKRAINTVATEYSWELDVLGYSRPG